MSEPWTLQEAHRLVKAVKEDLAAYGFFATVGGSVLDRGMSKHDIDLFMIPFNGQGDPLGLVTKLAKYWGKPRDISSMGAYKIPSTPSSTGLGESFQQTFRTITGTEWSGALNPAAPTLTRRTIMSEPFSYGPEPPPESEPMYVGEDDSPDTLRRAIQDPEEWEFTQEPNDEGTFRYSLRFFRGKDLIDVAII